MNRTFAIAPLALMLAAGGCQTEHSTSMIPAGDDVKELFRREQQITRAAHGHILTNTGDRKSVV